LDDCVFSCAARILREVQTGAAVTVATVFSDGRGRPSNRRQYVVRREEDRRALGLLGAKALWLGLLDAPYRNPFSNSFKRIVLEMVPDDEDYIQIVRAEIENLLDKTNPDAIYLPLGVGTH